MLPRVKDTNGFPGLASAEPQPTELHCAAGPLQRHLAEVDALRAALDHAVEPVGLV